MKDIILRLLFLIVIGELVTIFFINSSKNQDKVLAESTISTPVPSPIPTPRETLMPTPKPTPTRTPTPIPISVPKFTSQQINEFIDRFASQYGVDPNVIRHIAVCESGFNAFAHNFIYKGLFQFGPITWLNIRKDMREDIDTNIRLNAEEAVQTAAYALSVGKVGLWPNCIP